MKHSDPVATAYARSLMELAAARGIEVSVGQELDSLGQILAANPTLGLYFSDPSVSREDRAAKLKAIFSGRISPLLLNTLGVMNAKDRLSFLGALVTAYDALLEEKMGRIEVDVTVASKLDQAGMDEVRLLVGKALKKDAIVHQHVDESLIGGLVLRVGDKLIDGSVKTQLEQLRRKLLTTAAAT